MRKLLRDRKKAGLCTGCGDRRLETKTLCAACAERLRNASVVRHVNRRAAGLCIQNGCTNRVEFFAMCEEHRRAHNERKRKGYRRRHVRKRPDYRPRGEDDHGR